MDFAYEAMTSDGRIVNDRAEGNSSTEIVDQLRSKGMTVMRVEPVRGDEPRAKNLGSGSGRGRKIKSADLVLFTQQLKMLLEAGSALVPALEAIEQQVSKTAVKKMVRAVRTHVEEGGTLTEAFQERQDIFKPVFCSMVAAGEATAQLPEAFDRLNELAVRQQSTRKTIIGALLYPAILAVLCLGVACVVLFFVVPRFSMLFKNLNSPLPALTQVLFIISQKSLEYWPYILGGLVAMIVGIVILFRVRELRMRIDNLLLGAPIIGPLARRLLFARVLQIWAAMLRCHVPLLETIRHSKTSLSNVSFIDLVERVEESVSGGGSIGRTLIESGMVEPVIASAIRTGEENGRLSESVEFVSKWVDQDNTQLIAGLARIVEPAMLAIMGAFVGMVAMSLFIPLFDLAMAGG